jgi:hypothetical protein
MLSKSVSFSEQEVSKLIQNGWIANDGTVYASSQNILYRSNDQGNTWREIKAFDCESIDCVYINSDSFLFVSPGVGAQSDASGLWRSRDMGETWKRVLVLPLFCSIWSIAEDTNKRLFAGIYTRGKGKKAELYRSTDGGKKWDSVFYDRKARHIHQISIDKNTGFVYASVGDKSVPQSNVSYVVRSVDGGKAWTKILAGLPQILAIEAVPGARLFGTDDACNGQIFRTTDDKSFSKVMDTGAHAYCFWIRRDEMSGRLFASFVGGEGRFKNAGIYVSDNNGFDWSIHRMFSSDLAYSGSAHCTNFVNGTIYYSVKLNGNRKYGVRLSSSGLSWESWDPANLQKTKA